MARSDDEENVRTLVLKGDTLDEMHDNLRSASSTKIQKLSDVFQKGGKIMQEVSRYGISEDLKKTFRYEYKFEDLFKSVLQGVMNGSSSYERGINMGALKTLLKAGAGEMSVFADLVVDLKLLPFAIHTTNIPLIKMLGKDQNLRSKLLENVKKLYSYSDEDKSSVTSIHLAAILNDTAMIKLLLEEKEQVLTIRDLQVHPIEIALVCGNKEAGNLLIQEYFAAEMGEYLANALKEKESISEEEFSNIKKGVEEIITKCLGKNTKLLDAAGAIVRDAAGLGGQKLELKQTLMQFKDKIKDILRLYLPTVFFNTEIRQFRKYLMESETIQDSLTTLPIYGVQPDHEETKISHLKDLLEAALANTRFIKKDSLHAAIQKKDLSLIEISSSDFLRENDNNFDSNQYIKVNPLHVAALLNREEIITELSPDALAGLVRDKDSQVVHPIDLALDFEHWKVGFTLQNECFKIMEKELGEYFQQELKDKMRITNDELNKMERKVKEILTDFHIINESTADQVAASICREAAIITGRKLNWENSWKYLGEKIKEIIMPYLPFVDSTIQKHHTKLIKGIEEPLETLVKYGVKEEDKTQRPNLMSNLLYGNKTSRKSNSRGAAVIRRS